MRRKLSIKAVVLGAAFALMASASPAQAASITFSNCLNSAAECAALSGTVTVNYFDVTDGISVEIVNNTNADATQLQLLFDTSLSNNTQILTGGATPTFTTYDPDHVLDGALMSTQTFSSPYNNSGFQFNVDVNLPPPGNRLEPLEDITFWIAGPTVASLQFAMVHLQAVGDTNISLKLTPNGAVPDGGATLGLLGLAMLGVGYLRTRMT